MRPNSQPSNTPAWQRVQRTLSQCIEEGSGFDWKPEAEIMLRLPSQGHRGFFFLKSRPARILSSWILRSESFLSARSTASNSLNRKLAKTSYRAQLGAVQPTYLTQLLAGSHRKRLARSSHSTAHQHSGKAHMRTTDSRSTAPHQHSGRTQRSPILHIFSTLWRSSQDHRFPITTHTSIIS